MYWLYRTLTIASFLSISFVNTDANKVNELAAITITEEEVDEMISDLVQPYLTQPFGARERAMFKYHGKLTKLLRRHRGDLNWKVRHADDAVVVGEVTNVQRVQSYTYGTEVTIRVDQVVRGAKYLKGRKKGADIVVKQVNGRLVSPQERMIVKHGIEFVVGSQVVVGLSVRPSRLFFQFNHSPSPLDVRAKWFYKKELDDCFEVGVGGIGVLNIENHQVWQGRRADRKKISLSSAIQMMSDSK